MILKAIKHLARPAYSQMVAVLPPKGHVMLDYVRAHGCLPNLRRPSTFNEKMAWRKLYERDARFPDLIDKIKVKTIIGDRYGPDLIIPTLAVYDSPDEMAFAEPPLCASQYVIKCNHGSGMNIFVKDNTIDATAIKEKLSSWLNLNHADATEEWAYSQITPKILVEPYKGNLSDYKFHVFSGTVYAVETVLDRFNSYHINFYDKDWRPIDIKKYAGRTPSDYPVQAPKKLREMIKIAESIGHEFSYVRVDLYEIGGHVKFSELTFYSGAAFDRFEPVEWDRKFGQQWKDAARKVSD